MLVETVSHDELPSDLDDAFPLIENHVIDSLAVMTLIAVIEEEFDVRVDDEDLLPENFCTIAAIAGFVDSKRAVERAA